MHKMIRESKMLEWVRQWRAAAFDSMRRQRQAVREQRAREWADRLHLPIVPDTEISIKTDERRTR